MIDIYLNSDLDIEFIDNDLKTTNSLKFSIYNAITANRDLELICNNIEGSFTPYLINQNRITTKYLKDLKSEIIYSLEFLNDNKDIDDYEVNISIIDNSIIAYIKIFFNNQQSIIYDVKL
jgi:hypothetical protein